LVSGAAAIVAVAIVVNPTQTPLIQLAAAPDAGANASAMAPESSDDKMMSMPYPFVTYEYAAGPGLSNETGSGQVYKLARTGSPESVLTTVAKIFGVTGSVKKYPDFSDLNPGYFFGESDDPWGMDQKPTVSIWWSGTGSWNYYNPGDITMSSSPCVVEDTEGTCQEWAEVLPTPELLPSRAEAIATLQKKSPSPEEDNSSYVHVQDRSSQGAISHGTKEDGDYFVGYYEAPNGSN
jgi:hypothetical protein